MQRTLAGARTRTTAAIAAVALCLAAAPQPAAADAATVLTAKLPTPRYGASAVFDGRYVWVFGGYHASNVPTDQIVRFDTATESVTVSAARLPSPRWSTSAVYDGARYAYVFGGSRFPQGSQVDDIVRFDTQTGVADLLPGRLPSPRWGTSAVWAGGVAYVFGGRQDLISKTEIVRFDPATGAVTTAANLPSARYGTSAAWDGSYAYVIGGEQSSSTALSDIVRYRPATAEVMTLAARLPVGKKYTSAVWDGTRVQVFGDSFSPPADQIVRFTPSTGAVEIAGATLPSQRQYTAAIWDGSAALLFGGTGPGTTLDEIVRYSLEPGPPQGLTTIRGPGKGQITLNWYPPKDAAGLTGYRIYGGASSGARGFLAEIGNATSWTDSGLADGQARYYAVRAVGAFGAGAFSEEASGAAPVPPGAPQELQALPDGVGRVLLRWRAPETFGGIPLTPGGSYHVYRATAAGAPGVRLIATAALSYVDAGCRLGFVCRYFVTAVNAAGPGPASNETLSPGTAL